ncbi:MULTISPECIES: hypothetical protein [Exiguobacterium]|uniref:hypothetical protein n=1 Tax=Exiguobacterium TaxID=33986 RepID=UPI001AE72F1C|nr:MULTISPECIES: hypothetical protein [Exiguobacterium]MCT4779615.1 hypothetical protein [Exiguobacterium soli]
MLTTIASIFAVATMLTSGIYLYVYLQKKQQDTHLSVRYNVVFTSLIVIFGIVSLLIIRF